MPLDRRISFASPKAHLRIRPSPLAQRGATDTCVRLLCGGVINPPILLILVRRRRKMDIHAKARLGRSLESQT